MQWNWKMLVAIVIVAVAAGWLLTRSVREPATDLTDVDRDLAELAQALRADARTDVELIPRVASGIHFPNTLPYVRPAEFWRPVLGRAAHRMGRAARRRRR